MLKVWFTMWREEANFQLSSWLLKGLFSKRVPIYLQFLLNSLHRYQEEFTKILFLVESKECLKLKNHKFVTFFQDCMGHFSLFNLQWCFFETRRRFFLSNHNGSNLYISFSRNFQNLGWLLMKLKSDLWNSNLGDIEQVKTPKLMSDSWKISSNNKH